MFIEWPADAFPARVRRSRLVLSVGSVRIGRWTPAERGQEDRRPTARRKRLQWNDDVRHCHILFVSSSDAGRIGELSRRVEGRPILIVGETTDLAKRGAIINFRIEDGRVRFDINVECGQTCAPQYQLEILKSPESSRGLRRTDEPPRATCLNTTPHPARANGSEQSNKDAFA